MEWIEQANIPVFINDITFDKEKRIQTKDVELNRVLGGGIVPGSVILLGGDPWNWKINLVVTIN